MGAYLTSGRGDHSSSSVLSLEILAKSCLQRSCPVRSWILTVVMCRWGWMLRRWCWTSTSDAAFNVLYQSCRFSPESYRLLQTGDAQWSEAVFVVDYILDYRIFDRSCLYTIIQIAYNSSYTEKNITVTNTLLLARYEFQKSHLALFGIEHLPILDVKLHISF